MNVGRHLMLVNCDIKSLELVVVAQLSNDTVMGHEIVEKQDLHENNRMAFGLPSRLIAKVFNFRLVYGGSAYSYANDADFRGVSTSQEFWQDVIDQYYAKYTGIAAWHKALLIEAQTNGRITIPSGRYYPIVPDITKRESWPLTIIKNYPVQGFGADLVMLARLRASQLLSEAGIEASLVGTIHDSIVVDCPGKVCYTVGEILKQSVEQVPGYCKKIWGYDFALPLTCELSFGKNKTNMEELVLH